MTDRYTKTVLTIIAVAVVAIACEQAARLMAYGGTCGAPETPCYISTPAKDWLAVRVLP